MRKVRARAPRILYEVYDGDEVIGTITGEQLREAAGLTRSSPVFNMTLVERFNANKERAGEPERVRQVLR